MKLLDSAGYDARAMPAFFERMENANRLMESDAPEFLRTHPVTSRRIAESQDQARSFPVRQNPDPKEFLHMQARLRVLDSGPDTALRYYQELIGQQKTDVAPHDRYGYALALLSARQFDAARRESGLLLKANPSFLPYLLLQADIEMADNHVRTGLAQYRSTIVKFPKSMAALQKYTEALNRSGQYEEARKQLDQAVRQHPEEPVFYKLLATAAGESGHPREAHRAFGEYYYRIGNPRAAVEQLELAIKHANNSFYYTASLEARIREIREQSSLIFKRAEKSGSEKRK